MILLHENLPREAQAVARAIRLLFGIPVRIIEVNCELLWTSDLEEVAGLLEGQFPDIAILLLTWRDLALSPSEWSYGCSWGATAIVSTARMTRYDGEPSPTQEVPFPLYARRVLSTAIHELGHGLVHGQHHAEALWVDAQGATEPLGPHCTDNTCVMYESVDVRAPSRDAGFLLLGGEPRFDAGMDELLERMRREWFCASCRNGISISEEYLKITTAKEPQRPVESGADSEKISTPDIAFNINFLKLRSLNFCHGYGG